MPCPFPLAVILGNHDRGRDRSGGFSASNWRCLGPPLCLGSAGASWDPRPFHCRGHGPAVLVVGIPVSKAVEAVYGPVSRGVRERIVRAADQVPADQPLVVMAHCGPSGWARTLPAPVDGTGRRQPWIGVIRILPWHWIASPSVRVPDLVVFGHMHHQLKRGSWPALQPAQDRRGIALSMRPVSPVAVWMRHGRRPGAPVLGRVSAEGRLTHLSHRWYQPDGRLVHQETLSLPEPWRADLRLQQQPWFWHAARDAAVLQQLRRLRPDWRFVVSSQISSWLPQPVAGHPIAIEHRRSCRWDVGMIQADALGSDPEGTIVALADLEQFRPDQLLAEATGSVPRDGR